jgi:cytochrome d ubiquinol oxidase subunit II
LLGGLVTLSLFLTHGAAYLALKTEGDLRARANAWMLPIGLVASVLAVVFLVWVEASKTVTGAAALSVVAALALLGALAANRFKREGWAFILTGVTLIAAVAALFANLYPNVMVSSTDPAYSLTVSNASSTELTLQIMTAVAIFFTPIVLAYQGWTYWVFRKRVTSPRATEA